MRITWYRCLRVSSSFLGWLSKLRTWGEGREVYVHGLLMAPAVVMSPVMCPVLRVLGTGMSFYLNVTDGGEMSSDVTRITDSDDMIE